MAGVAVGMLLKPSRGVRDDIVRAGGKPKDHIKENVQALRATQKLNRIKKEDESKPEPAPFKLKEFSNVPSKISTRRPSASSSAAGSAGSSGTSTPFEATRPSSAEGPDAHKPKKNFIAINSAKVKNSPAGSKVEPKHRIGQVPK
nr:hypothetical protein HK105_001133 [Polyrhizophydium stewartii]